MLAVVYKGEWQHENVKPIQIKKHPRLLKSFF